MRLRIAVRLAVIVTILLWPAPVRLSAATGPWILHATDPHLWVDTIPKTAAPIPKADADYAKKIERQRALNAAALKDLLARASDIVGVEGEPRLAVLSGDVDADPCWIAGVPRQTDTENRADIVNKCLTPDPAQRTAQIQLLVDALFDSPIHDILILPGNNDIAREATGPAVLGYFSAFIVDVQKGLTARKSAVTVRNLTGCYAGGPNSDCFADVAGTAYRIVALPSYSFKNGDAPALMLNDKLQQDELAKFSMLVSEAQAARRKVIVVTHVPNIDDPFNLAQDRFSDSVKAKPDAKVSNRSSSSAWNVTKPVLDAWMSAVTSDAVVAVLAGHLHDSHKEIYRTPYTWASVDGYSQDRGKLLLTPPLAVKNQDGSPIQARGASLIDLGSDRVERELLWYEPDSHTFVRERQRQTTASPSKPRGEESRWRRVLNSPVRLARWIWHLGGTDIAARAVILIALLFAFMTVARVWQIPPPDRPFAGAKPSAGDSSAPAGAQAPPAFEPSPFAGPFGKTVSAGVAGLVAEAFVKSFSEATLKNDKELYIVYFVLFFLAILIISAVLQGAIEALRVRLAMVAFRPLDEPESKRRLLWARRMARRFWRWLLSLRTPLLVLADTFFNKIQGRNQTVTTVFEELVESEHDNIIKVIEVVRRQLNDLILREVVPSPSATDVRVNISVMSADRTSVYYVATPAKGSTVTEFPLRSVAWVSVFTGRIRWYLQYAAAANFAKIVLFDNKSRAIVNENDDVMLADHYQQRDDDYEAFVVLPIPWPRRGADTRVIGAIHISFRRKTDFDQIWTIAPDPVVTSNKYDQEEQLLPPAPYVNAGPWLKKPIIASHLREAIEVLAEALKGFNENLFWYSKRKR